MSIRKYKGQRVSKLLVLVYYSDTSKRKDLCIASVQLRADVITTKSRLISSSLKQNWNKLRWGARRQFVPTSDLAVVVVHIVVFYSEEEEEEEKG